MLLLLVLQNVIGSLPNEPAFLFVLSQEKLTAAQQRQVEQMCQANEELSMAYERILSELRPDYQYLCQFSSTNGIHNFFHWMRFSHAIFNQSRCDTPLFESNGPSIFLQAIVLDNTQEALPSPATSLYNNRIASERL